MLDHLADYPVERVAAWYRRLADAAGKAAPELHPSLASRFLHAWLDNRNPRAEIGFDAPSHLKSSRAVFDVQAYHREVFLTNKKARLSGGSEQWAGILPRINGSRQLGKWNVTRPLSLEYESLCDIAPNPLAIVSIQLTGTSAEKDIMHSLRGFQLKSKVTVVGRTIKKSAPIAAGKAPLPQAFSDQAEIQFVSWECSGRDRYDWNYSEHLTVNNPDYGSNANDAIRPSDAKLVVFHTNAQRLEKAGLAAPYDVRIRSWSVTEQRITGRAVISIARELK